MSGQPRGRPRDGGERVRSVVVDSRRAEPGSLFVALAGERRDGHAFVADAFANGAAAAIVQSGRDLPDGKGTLIEVSDPADALMKLAAHERSELSATVVAVTGSTGKTCTKDFITAVLATRLRVVASPASYNNEVGLPLTVLSASSDTDALVCEMGARGIGHLRLLCDIAKPHIGVVTNVGVAHMELFGSLDNIREAKAELPESLPPEGTAVLNADDAVVRAYERRTKARALFFGSTGEVLASSVSIDARSGQTSFVMVTPGGSARVALPLPGEHIVPNALAAAAVGHVLGVPPREAATGLARASVAGGRMEMFSTEAGLRVINDAYNANPVSMAGALKAARRLAGDGRLIAVLGQMAELGPIAADEHERIGELLVRLGVHDLVVVGREAGALAAGALREGMEPERVRRCEDAGEAVEEVGRLARPGDLVLVKGSRVARLERVADALRSLAELGDGARV